MALIDNLISCWELDEASGDALDAHGSNTLTANNSPGAASGVISGCRTFNGTNQFFSADSSASLEFGDTDFMICGWLNIASNATNQSAIGKWDTNSKREYRLSYSTVADRFRFEVSPDGTNQVTVSANVLGSPSTSTWYWVVGYHSAAANEIGISVNNGTFTTATHSTGIYVSNAAFRIGNLVTAGSNLWNGSIDQCLAFNAIKSAGDLTSIYNSGSGLAYSSWAGGAFKPYWRRPQTQMIGGGTR
jgi:hypothetical protein